MRLVIDGNVARLSFDNPALPASPSRTSGRPRSGAWCASRSAGTSRVRASYDEPRHRVDRRQRLLLLLRVGVPLERHALRRQAGGQKFHVFPVACHAGMARLRGFQSPAIPLISPNGPRPSFAEYANGSRRLRQIEVLARRPRTLVARMFERRAQNPAERPVSTLILNTWTEPRFRHLGGFLQNTDQTN